MIIIMPKPLRDATAAHSSEHPSKRTIGWRGTVPDFDGVKGLQRFW